MGVRPVEYANATFKRVRIIIKTRSDKICKKLNDPIFIIIIIIIIIFTIIYVQRCLARHIMTCTCMDASSPGSLSTHTHVYTHGTGAGT